MFSLENEGVREKYVSLQDAFSATFLEILLCDRVNSKKGKMSKNLLLLIFSSLSPSTSGGTLQEQSF
jgi:hypothetical protein